MPKLSLQLIEPDRLGVIAKEWRALSGEDEFSVELSTLFDWAETHLEPNDGYGFALALVDVDTKQTHAILEVINTKQGKLSKLLKFWLSPEFWNLQLDNDSRRDLVLRIHVESIVGVIMIGIGSGVDDVKIYGRNNLMLNILKAVQSEWPKVQSGTEAVFEGRWLRVRRK